MKLRPILQDSSDFAYLRKGGFVYVDKTDYFHRMIMNAGSRLQFISRPRRFGKSLMISTLAEIFAGNRDLFKGLKIDSLEWDWKPHTVFRLSFGGVNATGFGKFETSFAEAVKCSLQQAGFAYDSSTLPEINFKNALASAKDVVVLIDEYDAPVGHALGDPDLAEKIRASMAAFYIQLKECSDKIRFLLVTGVSKLAKLSVFSALNNIVDMSMEEDYAAMLGYTERDLDECFDGHLREHAAVMGLEYAEYRQRLKERYNGFKFCEFGDETVYSPISLAMTLAEKHHVFKDYWSSTGRASMLMNALKREDFWEIDPDGLTPAVETEFDVVDFRHISPIALLHQAGYLTIKDYDAEDQLYYLGAPNLEVRRDLAGLVANMQAGKPDGWARQIGKHLLTGKWEAFFDGVNSLYAALPHMKANLSKQEVVYRRELMLILAAQGFEVRGEVTQSAGRADVVMESAKSVYVFELKVDAPAADAVKQIEDTGYAEPYKACGKRIWLVGMSFSSKARRVVEFAVKSAHDGKEHFEAAAI